jgi:ATP-dependent Zn protease
MRTEIVLVELNVYEKNLNELIAEYERIHANYVSSLQSNNTADANRLLLQLESMNQEIQLLSQEIAQKIQRINQENKYGTYTKATQEKRVDVNRVYNKMLEDEKRIKELLDETHDLDGKNETLRLQQKSSLYSIYVAVLVFIIISILFFKFVLSIEQDPIENILLFLGIFLLFYFSWTTISRWVSAIGSVANKNYDSSSFMYRLLN